MCWGRPGPLTLAGYEDHLRFRHGQDVRFVGIAKLDVPECAEHGLAQGSQTVRQRYAVLLKNKIKSLNSPEGGSNPSKIW